MPHIALFTFCSHCWLPDIRTAQCWTKITNNRCEESINGDVPLQICCNTVGKGWGSPCDECPPRKGGKLRDFLCSIVWHTFSLLFFVCLQLLLILRVLSWGFNPFNCQLTTLFLLNFAFRKKIAKICSHEINRARKLNTRNFTPDYGRKQFIHFKCSESRARW